MRFIQWLICLCFITQPAFAAPYYAAKTIPPTLISPPYANGSAEQKTDLESIIAIQAKADPAEVKAANAERSMSVEMFAAQVDASLTPANYPKLYILLTRVEETSRAVTDQAKDYYAMKRPYLLDSRIKTLVKPHDNPAYPSGHTSGGYILAHTLGMVMPQKQAEFLSLANSIANHRVLVGMHFPHDLTGGRELAWLMAGALTQTPQFQADLAAAKKEMLQEK